MVIVGARCLRGPGEGVWRPSVALLSAMVGALREARVAQSEAEGSRLSLSDDNASEKMPWLSYEQLDMGLYAE